MISHFRFPKPAGEQSDVQGTTFSMLQQILAVFFVLGLLLTALWLLRRRGLGSGFNLMSDALARRGQGRRLRSLERLVLTPQHSLHLVSVENRVILFAASPSGCQAVESAGMPAHEARAHDGVAC